MGYSLSPPPFLTSSYLLPPPVPPSSHIELGVGDSAIPGQVCTVLNLHRWVPLPRCPSFGLLLSSKANTNAFVYLCQHPHPAHLALSELIPLSLYYAPIVLRTRLHYEGFPTTGHDLLMSVSPLGCMHAPEGWVVSCWWLRPPTPYRCLSVC